MNRIKKLAALLLILSLLAALVGCSTPSGLGGNSGSDSLLDKAAKLLSAEGREYDKLYTASMNEALTNSFFEFTITSASSADELEDYVPQTEGYRFLIADVTVKNVFGETIPVGNYDFYVLWNGGEDVAYYSFTDEMYPDDYDLADGESLSGRLVFELPADAADIMIGYTEIWDDDFEGNIYLIEIKP